MASTKQRYQNPTVGDTVQLRLFVYNQNNFANLQAVTKVEIYYLDKTLVSADNPQGRRLVTTVAGSGVIQDTTGQYYVDLTLPDPQFVIGEYIDSWTVSFEGEPNPATIENRWKIYPDLWFTSPMPVVYDFQFRFSPNRFRFGEKKYLRIEIAPNVPRASDLARYYENLAIVSDIRISMAQACGECVPAEADLRLVIDREPVELREKRFAFYQLDTEDMDCGIYDVWFELNFADNKYISDKYQLQVYN